MGVRRWLIELASTHRGHGHCIAKGVPVAPAMQLEADYRDLVRVAHVHPALAELVTDAAASI